MSSHVTLQVPAHPLEAFVHEVSNVQRTHVGASEALQAVHTLPPEQSSDTPSSPAQVVLPKQGDFLNSTAKALPSEQADTPSFPEKTILSKEREILDSPQKNILPKQAATPSSSIQTISPKQGDIPNFPEKTIPPKEGPR